MSLSFAMSFVNISDRSWAESLSWRLFCGKVGYNIQAANGPCGRNVGDKRCRGINQSALQANDWRECTVCNGEGYKAAICEACDGAGWVFVRNRRYSHSNMIAHPSR
jgi:hypothetical protein